MFTGTEFMSQCTASNLAEPIPRTASKPELGEILVFTDNRSEAANILEFASLLAEENGARLISVFMQPEPAITPAETFARGKGMLSVIEVHRAELEGIETHHRLYSRTLWRRTIAVGCSWRNTTEVCVLRSTCYPPGAVHNDLIRPDEPSRIEPGGASRSPQVLLGAPQSR